MKKKLSLFMAIVMMLSVFSFNVVAMAAEEVNGPFAFIESHPQNAAFSGNSVDVTGWALKTEGTVSKIDMSKTSVSIGGSAATATVVPVSRPDVKAAFAGKNLPDAIFDTVGYKATVDISGITAGTESHVLKLTFNDSTGAMIISQELNFTKAAKEIKPNLLNVDLPKANAQIGETTFDISGWALASKDGETDAIAKIGVKVGSATEIILAATDRFERTDVKNVLTGYPEASYTNAGFKYTADAAGLNDLGATIVTVTTYDSANTVINTYPVSVNKVAPGNKELLAVVDSPKAGDKFVNSLSVSGWALLGVNNADGIAQVKVVATDSEGTVVQKAFDKAVARADINATSIAGYPTASYATPGFNSTLDITALKNGKVTVVTSFLNASGSPVVGAFSGSTVEVEKATSVTKPSIIIVDSPAAGTIVTDNKVKVFGWALASADGKVSNIESVNVQVTGQATETPVTATTTHTARPDVASAVPGYGDYTTAGFTTADLSLSNFANGDLTVTVTIKHKDGSADKTASCTITKNTTRINLTNIGILNSTTLTAIFDNAPATAFVASDFVIKSDSSATPAATRTISNVVASEDLKTYVLTVPTIAVDHYVSIGASSTNKFVAALSPIKFAAKFALAGIEVNSATKITLTLATASTTALTNENIKDFSIVYSQSKPVKTTMVIIPTALAHDPDLSSTKVALTIPSLANSEGKLNVNGTEINSAKLVDLDFYAPDVTEVTVVRKSATSAQFNGYTNELENGYVRYFLDPTGTAAIPSPTIFDKLKAEGGTTYQEVLNKTPDVTSFEITGLTADTNAQLFVVYADNFGGTYADTKSNKSEIKTYQIQAAIQPQTTDRKVIQATDELGKVITDGGTTKPAYVIVSDTPSTIPNRDSQMPTTTGFLVGIGRQLSPTIAKVGQYVSIYEAKGTTTTDINLVGAYSQIKLTQGHFTDPHQPVIAASQVVNPNGYLSIQKIEMDQLFGCILYASTAKTATDFDATKAYPLTYSATAVIAQLPSNIVDNEAYYVYLVHTASGSISENSAASFKVDSSPISITEEAKVVRTGPTTATVVVSVNKDIAASGTATTNKWGLFGKLDSSSYVKPVITKGSDEAIVKDVKITINLTGAPITTGHGTGIGALTEGKKFLTLQVFDQAGNSSEAVEIEIPAYVANIPADKTYKVIAASTNPATQINTNDIYASADGKYIYANVEPYLEAPVAYDLNAPSFAAIMKLFKTNALTVNDQFTIDADGLIKNIIKNSAPDKTMTVEGLLATEVAAKLFLTNTSTGNMTIKGDIGANTVELYGTTNAIFDLTALKSPTVVSKPTTNFVVKALSPMAVTPATNGTVTVNGVVFTFTGTAAKVKPLTDGAIAVAGSDSPIAISAAKKVSATVGVDMAVDTKITFDTALQGGAVTLNGLAPAASSTDTQPHVLSLSTTNSTLYASVNVASGVVDVSDVTTAKTIFATASVADVQVTAGGKSLTVADATDATQLITLTHNIVIKSALNVTVNAVGGFTASPLVLGNHVRIDGTITKLSVKHAGAVIQATNKSGITGAVEITDNIEFNGVLDLHEVFVGGTISFTNVGSAGVILLNPSNKLFTSKFKDVTSTWNVGTTLSTVIGNVTATHTTSAVTLSAKPSGILQITNVGTQPQGTATFYLIKDGKDKLQISVSLTELKYIKIEQLSATNDAELASNSSNKSSTSYSASASISLGASNSVSAKGYTVSSANYSSASYKLSAPYFVASVNSSTAYSGSFAASDVSSAAYSVSHAASSNSSEASGYSSEYSSASSEAVSVSNSESHTYSSYSYTASSANSKSIEASNVSSKASAPSHSQSLEVSHWSHVSSGANASGTSDNSESQSDSYVSASNASETLSMTSSNASKASGNESEPASVASDASYIQSDLYSVASDAKSVAASANASANKLSTDAYATSVSAFGKLDTASKNSIAAMTNSVAKYSAAAAASAQVYSHQNQK